MKLAIYNKGIPFDGAAIASRPLGGSESSIIYMARELAQLGHCVTVYANCAVALNHAGVSYRHYHNFFTDYRTSPWDVVIAFRSFDPMLLGRIAPRMIFWTGDSYDQPALTHFAHPALQENVDLVFCVSNWHRDTFIRQFNLPAEKVIATRNGFAAELVDVNAERSIASSAYTSTPFRGLAILLHLFPEIRHRIPGMTLDVFSSMKVYGWDAAQDDAAFGALYRSAKQPGVNWHGSVAQPVLVNRLSSTGLLLYPNTFDETSCIAAIEAQAAGCVVITSAKAGLNETVLNGETGICLKGNPHSPEYHRAFVDAACGTVNNPDIFWRLSTAARDRAFRHFNWSCIASEWIDVLKGMPALPVSGRFVGPLSLLERLNEYVRLSQYNAAKNILARLDQIPFFPNEVQRFKTAVQGGTQAHGSGRQRDKVSSST